VSKAGRKLLRWAFLPAAAAIVALVALLSGGDEDAPLTGADAAALESADPANSISIVFIRADAPLDWSSPARVTSTALANYLAWARPAFSHPIGHALVHIRCAEPGGANNRHVWAGVTGGGTKEDLHRLVFGGEGLGILTASFHGRMMEKTEVLRERRYHRSSDRAQRIRFLVSESTCARTLAYYDEFIRAELYRDFGLTKRPRWREGAGCTTFVVSLLEIAGVKAPLAAWSRSVRLPAALVGERGRTVGLFELLYSKAAERWAEAPERGVTIGFVDVSKAESWIRTMRAAGDTAAASNAFGAQATFDDEGLIVDARDAPTPAEPPFFR
jgi:hypothetical protein